MNAATGGSSNDHQRVGICSATARSLAICQAFCFQFGRLSLGDVDKPLAEINR